MTLMKGESAGSVRLSGDRDGSNSGGSPELGTLPVLEEGAAFSRLTERHEVIVIGGGQAGLSVGYHLARRGVRFVILDASARVGDAWRKRWDSLRLFTPARYDGLVGMPFPAPPFSFPTKDEMADYLESYAKRFALPVRTGVRVDRLRREGDLFVVTAGARRFEAPQVVVAMSSYQKPRIPAFARELDPKIIQLHSSAYRNPSQLQEGGVLVVGAGNSGAEIAIDLAGSHPTWLAGRDTGHIPFRVGSLAARLFLLRVVLRFVFHRVLTVDTPLGRKARPKMLSAGGPLIRTRPRELDAAGVRRAPRVVGARDGKPVLEDGRVLNDVTNVIWSTGFDAGLSWIDLPIFDGNGEPRQVRGVVQSEPGLYFVGLKFLYSFSSSMVHGIARDAKRVAEALARRLPARRESPKTWTTPVAVRG
jgi:putative flavoprotein involved in K+ transport